MSFFIELNIGCFLLILNLFKIASFRYLQLLSEVVFITIYYYFIESELSSIYITYGPIV